MPSAAAVAFVTLGCPKNEVDSDRMAADVVVAGYRLVEDIAEADVVVLNTCAFIQPATEESIAEAFALFTGWRPSRLGRRVVIAGCLPSRYGDELASAMPEADAFVPVADEAMLVDVLRDLGMPHAPEGHAPGAPGEARIRRLAPGPTAYLKVSEGCDRRCAYCTIPAIRGPFISEEPDALVAEARYLLDRGVKELVLVGQDVAAYGVDREDTGDLADLIERLDALEGDFRIRVMYLQPDRVSDRLIETLAGCRNVCRYLDIPVQHAARSVLAAMRRPGDARTFLALLARLRSAMPDIVLRTTIMAGFPGETEGDVEELLGFLDVAEFDYAGVFAFSPEEGTPAAALPGQLSDEDREARAQRVRDVADAAGFRRAASLVGSTRRVLVEGIEDGELYGRTCGQAPDIDGVTFIDGVATPGEFVSVRITDALGYDLVGVPL